MRDMINVAFQNAWFGPYMIPNVYVGDGPEELPAGPVYNYGPMDGLKEASMHAQWFAQIPVVSAFQARLAGRQLSQGCPVGYVALNDRGNVMCVPAQMASAMLTGAPVVIATKRTFPVSPFYGFQGI